MPLRTKQPPKSVNCMGVGERGRNRTFNLLIKSQLLCQLSYAPTMGDLTEETICDCNIFADAWSWLRSSSSRSERAVVLHRKAHLNPRAQYKGGASCAAPGLVLWVKRGWRHTNTMRLRDYASR